jgi:hypothetical protein
MCVFETGFAAMIYGLETVCRSGAGVAIVRL